MGRKLPTDVRDFTRIRKEGYLYMDKTARVWHLARTDNPLLLLRPAGFGKTLLVSTFKAYWAGRRDLFEGLDICALEDAKPDAWAPHSVFHLSFDGGGICHRRRSGKRARRTAMRLGGKVGRRVSKAYAKWQAQEAH